MRIALINAFSLPSFVSGATLQVHRLALALTAEGHEVAVLGGARRPSSRALAIQDEVLEGLATRTVNTDPFLGITDPASYDNPAAATVVLDWLAEFKPDAIHAHSLHGLGAAWIDEAATLAPVVVTMHDCWWICSRQFLVDVDESADSPLLDAAGCACAGGVEFNQRRRAWLSTRLSHVEAVLVPSPSLRELMMVNGFDPDRVLVEENGLDLERRATGHQSPAAETRLPRLGFVGGWHDFKGLPLLLDAFRRLGPTPGFTLTCWGAEESPATASLPAGVELLPAYPPEETARVMDGLDGLVVPSIIRESYSLVVREALRRGVPVISATTGGPEDVLVEGENGLLVETGNAAAWTETLRRWGSDPGLRARLRAGAFNTAAGISTEAQAQHLLGVFAAVVDHGHRAPMVVAPVTAATGVEASDIAPNAREPFAPAEPGVVPGLLILAGMEGAPLRYRAHSLAHAHRLIGGRAEVLDHRDPEAGRLLPAGGLLLLHRVPHSPWLVTLLDQAREAGTAVAYSIDDLIIDPEIAPTLPALRAMAPADAENWVLGVRRYQAAARACGAFLATTPALAAAAARQGLTPFLLPYGLSDEVALLSQVALRLSQEARVRRREAGKVRIGYLSGTTTHDHDWAAAETGVGAILDRFPGVELWLAGHLVTGGAIDAADPRVKVLPFRPFQGLAALHTELDIVLAPLADGLEFNRCKAAVKWIEAAAAEVPVVASPQGQFTEVIRHGVNGMLATPGTWEEHLTALVEDPWLRLRLGRAARRDVYRDLGPWAQARSWAAALPEVLEAGLKPGPAGVTSPAPPASEVATGAELEPEAPAAYLDVTRGAAETDGDRLGGARATRVALVTRQPGLTRIDLDTTTYGRPAGHALQLRLLDADGKVLRAGSVEQGRVADGGWSAWRFDPIAEPVAGLQLEVSQPGADVGRGAAIFSSLGGEIHLRAWARPNRVQVTLDALGPQAVQARAPRPSRARVLWHKGRHSVRAHGVRATAGRVGGYLRRALRGRRFS
ncbi:MAG: glycosyltransferase [Candidatus Dormibacteria bacterium]